MAVHAASVVITPKDAVVSGVGSNSYGCYHHRTAGAEVLAAKVSPPD